MLKGRLNPDSGNPEIILEREKQALNAPNEEVVAKGPYEGIAFYKQAGKGKMFIVLGDYWTGEVPQEMTGVLLEVKVVEPDPLIPETPKTFPAWPLCICGHPVQYHDKDGTCQGNPNEYKSYEVPEKRSTCKCSGYRTKNKEGDK